LIATATQNNPKTQQAFLPTLPHLLTIISDRSIPSSVNVKALYAVSCLTRDSESGTSQFVSLDGLSTVRHCLAAEDTKLVVKALFMLMSYYATAQGEVKDKLVSELPTLVPELVSLAKTSRNDEVKGHALSTLVSMVTHHQVAVLECKKEEVGLQSVLSQLSQSLSPEEHEEELTYIKTLKDTCFS
jgi:hsp70-interacting protein